MANSREGVLWYYYSFYFSRVIYKSGGKDKRKNRGSFTLTFLSICGFIRHWNMKLQRINALTQSNLCKPSPGKTKDTLASFVWSEILSKRTSTRPTLHPLHHCTFHSKWTHKFLNFRWVAVILPDEKKGGCSLPFFLWFSFLELAAFQILSGWNYRKNLLLFLHWKRRSTVEFIEKSAHLCEFFRIPSKRLPVEWCRWVSGLKNAYLSSEIEVWRCYMAQRRCVRKKCGCLWLGGLWAPVGKDDPGSLFFWYQIQPLWCPQPCLVWDVK